MSKRLAIITGGSAGIGAATARLFLERGDDVLSIARRVCEVPGARSVTLDLAGVDDGFDARASALLGPHLKEVVAQGRPIVLVHNAAVLEPDSAVSMTAGQMARALAVNVVAPAALNRVVRPSMGPGSSILYVGSTLSEKAVAGVASYVTSKHALVGLMRATCQDLPGSGIHTACVCPGFTDTEMLRSRASDAATLASLSTSGRLVQPEEIARVLLFCADNPALNGAVIHANLGQIER